MATETQEKTYDKDLQRKVKDLIDSGKVNATTVAKGICFDVTSVKNIELNVEIIDSAREMLLI